MLHGSRARIGLILPADNVVIEPELAGLELPGVSFHGLRLTATKPEKMRAQAVELADTLSELGMDCAVYACAETSFNVTPQVRTTLSELIAERCGLPVVTATNAMLAALTALEIHSAAVVTPYNADSAAAFERLLVKHGVRVVKHVRRDFRENGGDPREWYATNRQPSSVAAEMARRADHPEAEAIVVAATNFTVLDRLVELEETLGKPVVSSNQAIVWWVLTVMGLSPAKLGLGRLSTIETDAALVTDRIGAQAESSRA